MTKSKSTQYDVVSVDESGDKKQLQFNAVGRDLPDEAKKVLNMPFLPISDTEVLDVLYQSQHKPFFLITENRDVFSKVIALISNADKLRELEKLVNSDILINKRQTTQLGDAVKDYDGQIAIRELQVDELKPFSTISAKASDVLEDIEFLEDRLAKFNEIKSLRDELVLLDKQSKINQIDSEELIKTQISFSKVLSLKQAYAQFSQEVPSSIIAPSFIGQKLEQLRSSFGILMVPEVEKLVIPDFIEEKLSALKVSFNSARLEIPEELKVPAYLKDKIDSLKEQMEQKLKAQEELSVQQELQRDINEQLMQFEGQTCPICGSVLDKEHLMNLANV